MINSLVIDQFGCDLNQETLIFLNPEGVATKEFNGCAFPELVGANTIPLLCLMA